MLMSVLSLMTLKRGKFTHIEVTYTQIYALL